MYFFYVHRYFKNWTTILIIIESFSPIGKCFVMECSERWWITQIIFYMIDEEGNLLTYLGVYECVWVGMCFVWVYCIIICRTNLKNHTESYLQWICWNDINLIKLFHRHTHHYVPLIWFIQAWKVSGCMLLLYEGI